MCSCSYRHVGYANNGINSSKTMNALANTPAANPIGEVEGGDQMETGARAANSIGGGGASNTGEGGAGRTGG